MSATLIRLTIASTLAVAAGLKGYQWLFLPAEILALPHGLWSTPFVVAFEITLAITIGLGAHWRKTRVVAIATFSVFAVYALWMATRGASSCGCFGPVAVSPWVTFGFDLVITAALARCPSGDFDPASDAVVERGRLGTACLFVPPLVILAVAWNTQPRPVQLTADSKPSLQDDSALIVLEPADWIGAPLPIQRYLDIDVSRGAWLVLLHRHGCGRCKQAVKAYEAFAQENRTYRTAIIEVPPFGKEIVSDGTACQHGRLDDTLNWFVETPVELELRDGRVIDAARDLPALKQTAPLGPTSVASTQRHEASRVLPSSPGFGA